MNSFYALIARMRNIGRWGLMRNSYLENVQEHSHMVAILAHALAVIRRDIFGQDADPEHVAAVALYHDAPEIYTGDLPSPVKYLNPEIRRAYKEVEQVAADRLLNLLPAEMRPAYVSLLSEEDKQVEALVKAADKLSAYIKCVEEQKAGNTEFTQAGEQLHTVLTGMGMPEVDYFMEHFMPAFSLSLDDLDLSN